ncbi:hypothetical protein GUITHDRAFT_119736 [Guillardia theta CCMP2712]|uniref:Uncharacterized protein n=1 Tax=Guillardia theta (strain CCMP2712) TaxID=905079 RepID=L1ICT8_GUITC|nr:hypothetical protein GUITHDRAFT_119736 [Guillardia theta CCMP2712]EKX34066.1 hypothetical protein GUITHDRAFT_119736 [Guillardia theta CCMP2712]|eukprot:XP_005821046.1 hypothetical protein GUITHDRAFT_119736 [Guillardia theta CCMP2712]
MGKKNWERNSKFPETTKSEAPKTRSVFSNERTQNHELESKKESKPSKTRGSSQTHLSAKKNSIDEEGNARRDSLRKTRNSASSSKSTSEPDPGLTDGANKEELTEVITEVVYLSPHDEESDKDFEFLIEDDQKESGSRTKYPPWPYFVNCRVEALYDDGIWYQGILKDGPKGTGSHEEKLFQIIFDDGEEIWTELPADDIRMVEAVPKKGLKVFVYLDASRSSKKSAILYQSHDNLHVKVGGKSCSLTSFCAMDDASQPQPHPYDAVWVAQSPELSLLQYFQKAFGGECEAVQGEQSIPDSSAQPKLIPGQEAPMSKRSLLPKDWKVLVKDDNSHYNYIAPDGTIFSNLRSALTYAGKHEADEISASEPRMKSSAEEQTESISNSQSLNSKEAKRDQNQRDTSEHEKNIKFETEVKRKGKAKNVDSKDSDKSAQDDTRDDMEVVTRSLRKRTKGTPSNESSSKNVLEVQSAPATQSFQATSSENAVQSEETVRPQEDRPASDAIPQTKVILFEEDVDVEEMDKSSAADGKDSEHQSDLEDESEFEGVIEEIEAEDDAGQGQEGSFIEEVEVDESSETSTLAVEQGASEDTQENDKSVEDDSVTKGTAANQRQFNVGDFVSVEDCTKRWCTCEILKKIDGKVKVHYINWSSDWDEWIDVTSDRIQESDVIIDNGKRKSSKISKESAAIKKPKPKTIKPRIDRIPNFEEKQSWVCSVDMKKGFANGNRYIGEQVRIRDRTHGLLRGAIDDFDERGFHVAIEGDMENRWIRLPDPDVDFLQIVAARPEVNQYPRRTNRLSFVCTGCEKQFQTKQGLHFHISRSEECQNVFYNLNIPLPPGIAWKISKKNNQKSRTSTSLASASSGPLHSKPSELHKSAFKQKKRKSDLEISDIEKRQKVLSSESFAFVSSPQIKDNSSSRASNGRSIASLVIAEVLRRRATGSNKAPKAVSSAVSSTNKPEPREPARKACVLEPLRGSQARQAIAQFLEKNNYFGMADLKVFIYCACLAEYEDLVYSRFSVKSLDFRKLRSLKEKPLKALGTFAVLERIESVE